MKKLVLPADDFARRGKFLSCAVPCSCPARAHAQRHLGAVGRHSPTSSHHNLVLGRSRSQKIDWHRTRLLGAKFSLENIRTKNSTGTAGTLTAQQFHDEDSGGGSDNSQVTFAQLGIKTDHVLVIKISHPDAGITGA